MSSRPLTPASFRMRPAAVDADHAIAGVAELVGVRCRHEHLAALPQAPSRLCARRGRARSPRRRAAAPAAGRAPRARGRPRRSAARARPSAARPASRSCAGRARPARRRARRGAGPTTCCRARCRRRGAPRARPAAPPRPRARAPRSAARRARRGRRSPPDAGERLAQRRDEAAAGAADLGAELGELRLPGRERVVRPCARAQAAQQLVALLERAGVGAGDGRVARPGARHRAVEIAPAQRRRALHHGQALGREDEDRGVLGERVDRRVGRAVDRRALGRARLEADRPRRRGAAQRRATRRA